jgi:hypothetical protein
MLNATAPKNPSVTTSGALATLIHLASFQERERAEAFARALTPERERTIYLQSAEVGQATWHRVLLGDFDSLADAEAFAERAYASGTYAYAQAVRVVPRGLEAWGKR